MVACNRGCGSADLHWKVVNGKYKLFSYNDLLHMCNDGVISDKSAREKATAKILNELGIREPAQIPKADKPTVNINKEKTLWVDTQHDTANNGDPKKMFTINTTANGIAITGDDKHNAIYLPKVAVPELLKALIDFV